MSRDGIWATDGSQTGANLWQQVTRTAASDGSNKQMLDVVPRDASGAVIGSVASPSNVNIVGSITLPTSRTWTLSSLTDSVTSFQGGAWSTGRTWTLASGSDSVSSVQSGTWTVQSVQSGTWSTGRTWVLNSATDSVTVTGTVSLTSESIEIGTVDQGTPNTLANAWPVKPTDGTNFQSFTGANEAKVSVTQPLPAGANVIGSTGRTWTLASGTDSVASVQSGTWTVQSVQSGTWTVAATQSGTWTTGRTWTLGSGTDSVASVQSGTWTTGRTWTLSSGSDSVSAVQSGSWTVTANAGTNLNTSALALETTQAKMTITPGTALGSNTLTMVGGSVTTAAPTYTTGNINPLSLTTAGALRTDGSGVTQPISGTVTANLGTIDGVATEATLAKLAPGTTAIAPTTVSVTTSATLVSAADATWTDRVFQNKSTLTTIQWAKTNAVTTSNGTDLGPKDILIIGREYTGDVYMIATSGSITVAVNGSKL